MPNYDMLFVILSHNTMFLSQNTYLTRNILSNCILDSKVHTDQKSSSQFGAKSFLLITDFTGVLRTDFKGFVFCASFSRSISFSRGI